MISYDWANRIVKQWEAHLLTKQHRTSVAREKAEEAARLAKAAKRAAPVPSAAPGPNDIAEPEAKRARTGEHGALPAGFFSKGNERSFSDDEGEDVAENTAVSPIAVPAKTGDAELDDFFASLAAPEETAAPVQTEYSITTKADTATKVRRAAYKEVAPGQASYEAAPVRNVVAGQEEEKEPTPEPEETPAQRKERLAREEREEIMARLEEEERAQYVI